MPAFPCHCTFPADPDTPPPFFGGVLRPFYKGPMGMNRTFKAAVAALIFAVGFAGSVAAGPHEDAVAVVAAYEDALAAYNKGDYAPMLRLMRPLAEQGVALGQYSLGVMYEKGQGVPQDYATAVSWYRKAAEQGLANAQYNIGTIYLNGQGVPQDYETAATWLRKAAVQGLADAQGKLGAIYGVGQGVPQDYVIAHMWFNLAAASGNKNAAEARDEVAAKMTPAQIAEAQKLAREWKPK
jgi:TPR repeat protein